MVCFSPLGFFTVSMRSLLSIAVTTTVAWVSSVRLGFAPPVSVTLRELGLCANAGDAHSTSANTPLAQPTNHPFFTWFFIFVDLVCFGPSATWIRHFGSRRSSLPFDPARASGLTYETIRKGSPYGI